MKKLAAGWLLSLALAAVGPAAERLQIGPAANDPEYNKQFSPARVADLVYPVYPAEPGAGWKEENVRVAFVVDATGAVTEVRVISGPERFQKPAVEAVKQWKFQPAIFRGHPEAAAYEVAVPFRPTGTPARSIREDFYVGRIQVPELDPAGDPPNAEPVYPRYLQSRRLSGSVELLLGIDRTGRVEGVQVLRASHPDFLSAALETVAAWECRPAHQGLLAVGSRKGVSLAFYTTDENGTDNHADWLEHNGIFLREPAGTKAVDYFDAPVEAVSMVDPVYPQELLLAGTRGGARVNFRIDAYGRVGEIAVAEATDPRFGAAVAAAIAAWQFRPLQRHGDTVAAEFSFTWKFEAPRDGSAEQRLLAAAPADQPVGARELDRPLFPLFRRGAIFPPDRLYAGEGGHAEIEFIIDRDGRVRLPRIRGASQPEFGWAAATAVSQWLFETPRRGGQPVDVRAAIPVEFEPPPRPARPEDAIKPPPAG